MKYLVIDTSTQGTIVGVFHDKKPLAVIHDSDNSKQNERLPIIIRDILLKLDLKFKDIDKILVTKGPGSFTGIRIGLAFARGLGFSMGIEVIGIDNFDALKGNCMTDNEVLVAIDSKKGDWYMKTKKSEAVAGDKTIAKEMIKGMKNPKIISYKSEKLGEELGINLVFETGITAFGIVNAYFSLDSNADKSPTPLYIRQADVTIKKCI